MPSTEASASLSLCSQPASAPSSQLSSPLLWLPVLAAAAFFGAALGDLLGFFAAEHLSPAAGGILAGLLTLAVVRSKTPLHTPFERMEQFKQKHHLDRLASFQLEFTLLCMVAFFLSISGIAVFSAAFDSLCAEGLIVPVGWIVCTYLCLFVSSFFIFNLFDLVIIWSALSILAVGCALLVSFASYAVYVPLTAAFGAAALFYPDTLNKISHMLSGSFFLLPYTTQEFYAIGFTKEGRETLKKSLKKALFEINQKMCESHMQDMILSENIYVYDSEEGNLQAV